MRTLLVLEDEPDVMEFLRHVLNQYTFRRLRPLERIVNHISHYDLEHFHVGIVQDEAELAIIEEHLLVCSDFPPDTPGAMWRCWQRSIGRTIG